MAILGFLAMLAIGGYMVVAGVAVSRLSLGFCGRPSVFGFIIFMIGVATIFLAIMNAPFTVSVKS